MEKWTCIPAVTVGIAATAYGCLHLSPLLTGCIGAATLWVATKRWGSGTADSLPADHPTDVEIDPALVRRYREEHPGTSITGAVAAVARSRPTSSDRAD